MLLPKKEQRRTQEEQRRSSCQFEHVSGYASKSNPDSGISVSKINILNTLIDQLVKIQSDTTKPKLPTDLTDSQVDILIKDYQDKIQTALNVAKTNPLH